MQKVAMGQWGIIIKVTIVIQIHFFELILWIRTQSRLNHLPPFFDLPEETSPVGRGAAFTLKADPLLMRSFAFSEEVLTKSGKYGATS